MSNNPPFSQFSPEEQRVFNKFPKMFRQANLSMQETCMCWGLEIPYDWYPVIEKLAEDIDGIASDCVEFAQIKEKYWSLRVYYDIVGEMSKEQEDQINKLIDKAEYECEIIRQNRKK